MVDFSASTCVLSIETIVEHVERISSIVSFIQRTITHRQRAEIQLEGLLNEPDEALPAFACRTSHHLVDNELSIDNVSKTLNTPAFIIERLLRALHPSNENNEQPSTILNRVDLQKLTRLLNSTIDVRALLFFMMLDENNDGYITNDELTRFYEMYFIELKTFDHHRLQEIIHVLLGKFHFDQVEQT
jgi:hypothetical protein